MAKIYVASAFANRPEAREVQAALRAAGHTITWDWTQEDASHLQRGSPEFFAFLEKCGEADFKGVMGADAVVVVAHPEMSDTKAEMGIALGAGIPVFVLYPERRHSVFYGRVVRIRSLEDLIDSLRSSPGFTPTECAETDGHRFSGGSCVYCGERVAA